MIVCASAAAWVSGCGDKALVDPLADEPAAKTSDSTPSEGTPSGSVAPLTLAASYSIERRVEADACNQKSTEGTTSQWTLSIDQDDSSLNAKLLDAGTGKILLHGTAGASSFQLTGNDQVTDSDCVKQLAFKLSGKLVDAKARGDLEVTSTYGSQCGVASGQSCIVTESFDSK